MKNDENGAPPNKANAVSTHSRHKGGPHKYYTLCGLSLQGAVCNHHRKERKNQKSIDFLSAVIYSIIVSQQYQKGGDDITKKVGRPYSENPKEIRLTVRLDKKHNDILEEHSKKNGISKNESVRRGIESLEEQKTE